MAEIIIMIFLIKDHNSAHPLRSRLKSVTSEALGAAIAGEQRIQDASRTSQEYASQGRWIIATELRFFICTGCWWLRFQRHMRHREGLVYQSPEIKRNKRFPIFHSNAHGVFRSVETPQTRELDVLRREGG